jgi:hypothetical protein
LEYQNLDLSPVDGVKLRKNEAEMGQAYAESGSNSPKYDEVVDIKTCTKKTVYGFFYNLANNPNTFEKFETPNETLKQQANEFWEKTKLNRKIEKGSFSLDGKYRSIGEFEYTNTRYKTLENETLADVDILLSSTIYFNYGNRKNTNTSTLSKENISFQVEYKDAKCNLIQTNFFEVVQKDFVEDSKSKSVVGGILFVILAIILSIVIFIIWLIIKIGKKVLGK